MALIIIIGPAYPLRGGIAAFNERIAHQLLGMGHEVIIYTFSLQYPSFLFPGKSQYSDSPPPADLDIRVKINTVNPLNWLETAKEIKRLRPDLVLTRFWIPFMAPSLGSILRRISKKGHPRILCIADNVIPHEKRSGDKALTSYFLNSCDAFIAMSSIVVRDLRQFVSKPVRLVPHPLYDHFGEPTDKIEARKQLQLAPDGKLLLFFGFIRKYKGLDLLLEALTNPEIKQAHIRLVVAGEFYEKEDSYRQYLQKNGLQDSVILHTRFITDDQVRFYFSAADAVVLPYRSATQSGIAPMAYHFGKPMIATMVGGLPETITDGETGILCQPDASSLSAAILRFYALGAPVFAPYLAAEKRRYSWKAMAEAILELGLG